MDNNYAGEINDGSSRSTSVSIPTTLEAREEPVYQRHNNADIERRSSVSSDGADTMRRLHKTEGMQRQERMSSVEEEETEHTNKNKAGLYICSPQK